MDELLAEEDKDQAWDSEFSSSPHHPWAVAGALGTPEAVPYLEFARLHR
jgi:hypothetical protein